MVSLLCIQCFDMHIIFKTFFLTLCPGNAALHYAASQGHVSYVKQLVYHGADPELMNIEGKKAIDLASHNKHKHIINYLIQLHSKHTETAVQAVKISKNKRQSKQTKDIQQKQKTTDNNSRVVFIAPFC